MNPILMDLLTEMVKKRVMISGIGLTYLIVLLVLRAGRLNDLNEGNLAERLQDLCFNTIRELINNKIEELLQIQRLNPLDFRPDLTIQQLGQHLYQDSRSLEELVTILDHLTKYGLHSAEFLEVLSFFGLWIWVGRVVFGRYVCARKFLKKRATPRKCPARRFVCRWGSLSSLLASESGARCCEAWR